jgi:excisionase family DNA binding protein
MSQHGIATLWRVEDVAECLRTSTRTVWRRVADVTIPVVRVGSVVRFSPEAVASVGEVITRSTA